MRHGVYGVLVCFLATACSTSNPSSPSASVASPVLLAPSNGAQIANSAQPVTLAVQNAVLSQVVAATYTFEVATDSAFANKVQTKSGVAAGASGQTSLTLGTLAAGSDYYWHAQAIAGGTTGVFSPVSKFTIGASVTITAPTALSPANGATVPTTPTLTVINATSTGPAGPIAYRFDISTSPTFATGTVTGSVVAGASQTSFTPSSALAANTTFYWRAVAIDQTSLVTSPTSAVLSFTTNATAGSVAITLAAQEGLTLWPNAQPPGTPGQAVLGNGWGVQNTVDFHGVPFVSPVIDALREFDLIDRGMDPQSALDWCHNNGYANSGVWVPSSNVVGFPQEYMGLLAGSWFMAIRSGG
jgi:hypothetical protein